MAKQASGQRRHTFAWLAAFVAVSAAAAGFANGSAQQPASARVVTEHQTDAPEMAEAAELASERQRLNRIKRNLNVRKRKLDRRRASLAAREAVLDAREAALDGREDDVAVARVQSTQSERPEQPGRAEQSARAGQSAGAPQP